MLFIIVKDIDKIELTMNNSIYNYIKSSIVDGKLPDDFSLPRIEDETGLWFADGARDGIALYHTSKQLISVDDFEILKNAIALANDHKFNEAVELLNDLSNRNRAIDIIDELQNHISENKDDLKAGNIYEFAIGLINLSDNREVVKYGLSILELLNTNNKELQDDIKVLALSDEFTFYCINIMKSWKDSNQEIFEIAKKLKGWGKIFAVEQLRALDPLYDEIRKWMLEEGINNNVMPSYSALSIWRNGNVGSTLYTKPSYKQLFYIGKIIDALLDESAVRGLSTLDKRKEIILVYLNEAINMPLVIDDYEVIYNIKQYFLDIDDSKEILDLADKILKSYKTKSVVLDAIKKARAIDLGIEIGIDVKPYVLSLIKNSFYDNYHLCSYLVNSDKYRKELLYEFKKNLPLEKMKTTPKESFGLGEEFKNERALEFLLQSLRRYPMEGIEFVETGLQCEPTRTRNGALEVLKAWVSNRQKPLSELLPEMHVLLMMLSTIEPSENPKNTMEKLINGDISFEEEVFTLEDEKTISKKTLDVLSDAISDIGVWQWWHKETDMIQMEFGLVQIYDYTKQEKQAHSSTIALRFEDNCFAMFLDNFNQDEEKKWFDKLYDDEIQPFDIDTYEFGFNDAKYVNEVFEYYKNKHTIKELVDEQIVSCKYILAGKCNDVGFVVGGNKLEVLTHHGTLSEENIIDGNKKWWEYWSDYWKLRKTKEAYEKDAACEFTIPIES